MGKNKSKNLVKKQLMRSPEFTKVFEKFVDDESMVAKNIAGSDDPYAILDVMKSTYDLELNRNDSEATARLLLNVDEIRNSKSNIKLGSFLDHLYDASRTVQGFNQVVEDVYNSVQLEPIVNTHARPVVDIVCTWIIVRTFLLKLLEEIVADDGLRKDNPAVNIGYVLTHEQEVRAKGLGLEVSDHLFDVDKFYQSECDLAISWKEAHGTYAPAYKLYGMNPKEYATWRKDVSDLIAELVAEDAGYTDKKDWGTRGNGSFVILNSDETVASDNIGKKSDKENSKKFELMALINKIREFKTRVENDPKFAKDIIDMVKANETVAEYIKMAEKEYLNIDPIPIEREFGLVHGAKKLDLKKAISLAILVASKTNSNPVDVAVFTIPMFCDDVGFVARFIVEAINEDTISMIMNMDQSIVAPKYLRDMVMNWSIVHTNKISTMSDEQIANLDIEEASDFRCRCVSAATDALCEMIRSFAS